MPAATLAADPPLDPPGDRVGSMRIARRAERRVFVGRPERELVQVGLADEDRAGLPQMRDRLAHPVPRRDPRARGTRRSSGRPANVEEVLDGDRHAVEWAAVAAGGELGVGSLRLTPWLRRP